METVTRASSQDEPGLAPRALVVSADPARAEQLVPMLEHEGLDVHRVLRSSLAHGLIREREFRLIVLVDPVPMIHRLLAAIRSESSHSRKAGVIFAAPADHLDDVRRLPVQPNQLVSLDRLDAEGRERIAALLHVAPRVGLKAWVQLRQCFASEAHRALCRTVNLSTSGMLLRGCTLLPVGTELAFELSRSARDRPITGTAKVVRHGRSDLEPDNCMGLTFIGLDTAGRNRLERYLAGAGGEPLADPTHGTVAPPEVGGSALAPPDSPAQLRANTRISDAASAQLHGGAPHRKVDLQRELEQVETEIAARLARGLQLRLRSPEWYLTGVELGLESLRDFYEISELVHRGDVTDGEVTRHLAALERVHRKLSEFASCDDDLDRRVMILIEARPDLERLLRELEGSVEPAASAQGSSTVIGGLVAAIHRRVSRVMLLERLQVDIEDLLGPFARLLRRRHRERLERVFERYRVILRPLGYSGADDLSSTRMLRELEREVAVLTASGGERIRAVHRRIYSKRFRGRASADLEHDLAHERVFSLLQDVLRAGYDYLQRTYSAYYHALGPDQVDRQLLQRASELAAALEAKRSPAGDPTET